MTTPSNPPEVGRAMAGPERTYSIGSYRFGRYGWRRWECTAHGRGVDMAPTPVHAFLRLRKWLKEPAVPIEEDDRD